MEKLKLRAIGNSVGVILPKDVLKRLKLEKGDELYLTATPDGIRLTPSTASLEKEMEIGREIMRKRRSALRELARR